MLLSSRLYIISPIEEFKMAKQVIKYESKHGIVFDTEADADRHDLLNEIHDTAQNRLNRYGFDISDIEIFLTEERENIETFYKNLDEEKEND